jgi:hypothetical protein
VRRGGEKAEVTFRLPPSLPLTSLNPRSPIISFSSNPLSLSQPYTVGCFGPVTSLDNARSLYATCTSSITNWTACTSKGQVTGYALDCPIFSMNGQTFNPLAPTPTATCPNCHGNCEGEYYSASGAMLTTGADATAAVAGMATALAAAALLVGA